MSGHTGYIPSGLLVYFFVTSMLNKAKSSRVRKSGPVMIFDATLFTKAVVALGAIGFSIGSVYLVLTTPSAALGVYVFSSLAVMCSIAFPSTISITKEGVQTFQSECLKHTHLKLVTSSF